MTHAPDKAGSPRDDGKIGKLKEKWAGYLRDHNLNTTDQRDAIVDTFLRTEDHLSVDDLLARVRESNPRVGYATVYRTMRLLVDAGLASPRQFGEGQTLYEVAGSHHDHLICLRCGYIVEFEDDEIERLQELVARKHGFKLMRHKHELYGLCPRAAGDAKGACPSGVALNDEIVEEEEA